MSDNNISLDDNDVEQIIGYWQNRATSLENKVLTLELALKKCIAKIQEYEAAKAPEEDAEVQE